MSYTIKNLLNAIHYCNKAVKCDELNDKFFKKEFYRMKRDLLYHLIKNYKDLGLTITKYDVKLYAFCISYEDVELKVHQIDYSKLTQLFKILNIDFPITQEYQQSEEHFEVNNDELSHAYDVVKYYFNKWDLKKLVSNLCDKTCDINDVFTSFVYYFPDFKFTVEGKSLTMGKKSIVKVTHRKSGRTYRLYLNTLRSMGESLLPIWRKKHVIYKCCL